MTAISVADWRAPATPDRSDLDCARQKSVGRPAIVCIEFVADLDANALATSARIQVKRANIGGGESASVTGRMRRGASEMGLAAARPAAERGHAPPGQRSRLLIC
jgi:hypothetical protein